MASPLVRDPFSREGRHLKGVLLVVVALVVVCLIAFARGPDHRRGQQLGARALGHDAHPASAAVA